MPDREAHHFSIGGIFRSPLGAFCPTINDPPGIGIRSKRETPSEQQEQAGDLHQSSVNNHLDTRTSSDDARSSRSPSVKLQHATSRSNVFSHSAKASPRTPRHGIEVDSVAAAPASSQMKHSYGSSWKPVNRIDGQFSATTTSPLYSALRNQPPPKRHKRTLDEDSAPAEDQSSPHHISPQVRVVVSAKKAKHVHNSTLVNGDDMDVGSVLLKGRLPTDPNDDTTRSVIHHKGERYIGLLNTLSESGSNGADAVPQEVGDSWYDPIQFSEPKSARAVGVIDYDEEFAGFSGNEGQLQAPLIGPRSTSHAIEQSYKQPLTVDKLVDSEVGVMAKRRGDDQSRRAQEHASKAKRQKTPVNNGIAALSKKPAPTPGRQPSPRLSQTFRRDNSAKLNEEGETDELVQSSPVEFINKRSRKSEESTQLGWIRKQSKLLTHRKKADTFKSEHVPNADIPPTRFVIARKDHQRSAKEADATEKPGPTKTGLILDSYFHGSTIESPLLLHTNKLNASFQVIGRDGKSDMIYSSKVKKGYFSGDGTHVKLDSVRSESDREGSYLLVFASHAGLSIFQNQLRLFAPQVQQIRETDAKLHQMLQTRLGQQLRLHPSSTKTIGDEEEQALLKRRVDNGRKVQQAQAAKAPTSKLRANMLLPRRGSQSASEFPSGDYGVDKIIYENSSDLEPSAKQSRPQRTDTTERSPRLAVDTSKARSGTRFQREGRRITRMETRSNQVPANFDISHRASTTSEAVKQLSAKSALDTSGMSSPWTKPLLFPVRGPNKVEVEYEDLKRLDEDEFLNDNLVQYGLRYVQEEYPSQRENVYMFNTYFYTSLTKGAKGRKNINYDAVKRWTSKIDLFDYNYVVVPINESFHWYVAIICNLRNIRRSLSTEANDLEVTRTLEPAPPDSSSGPTNQHPQHLPSHPAAQQDEVDMDEEDAQLEERTSKISLDSTIDSRYQSDMTRSTPNGIEASFKICARRKEAVRFDESIGKALENAKEVGKNRESVAVKSKMTRKGSGGKKYKSEDCAIITLDSFGYARSQATRNLKDYLREEAEAKRGMIVEDPPGMNAKGIPQQQNFSDCGLFLIVYVAKFYQNPSGFISKVLARELDPNHDWPDLHPSALRNVLRERIEEEYDRQNGTSQPADKSKLPRQGSDNRSLKDKEGDSASTKSRRKDTAVSAKAPADEVPPSALILNNIRPARETRRLASTPSIENGDHELGVRIQALSPLRSIATRESTLKTSGQHDESLRHDTAEAVSASEVSSPRPEPISDTERKPSTELSDLEDDHDMLDNVRTPRDRDGELLTEEPAHWMQQLLFAGRPPDGFEEADFMPFGANDAHVGEHTTEQANPYTVVDTAGADDDNNDSDETTPQRPPTRGKVFS